MDFVFQIARRNINIVFFNYGISATSKCIRTGQVVKRVPLEPKMLSSNPDEISFFKYACLD